MADIKVRMNFDFIDFQKVGDHIKSICGSRFSDRDAPRNCIRKDTAAHQSRTGAAGLLAANRGA
jgi:hypothetical protein